MAGRVEDAQYALIGARRIDAEAQRLATLAVCDFAGRGLDLEDPVHVRAAGRLARPLLEALGLAGEPSGAWIGHATRTTSYVHGTQSGVDHHLDAGHRTLCGACQRFVDVKEKRASAVCGEVSCGSVQAYWRHRNVKEPTCEWSRAAYRVHVQEQRRKGPAGR